MTFMMRESCTSRPWEVYQCRGSCKLTRLRFLYESSIIYGEDALRFHSAGSEGQSPSRSAAGSRLPGARAVSRAGADAARAGRVRIGWGARLCLLSDEQHPIAAAA